MLPVALYPSGVGSGWRTWGIAMAAFGGLLLAIRLSAGAPPTRLVLPLLLCASGIGRVLLFRASRPTTAGAEPPAPTQIAGRRCGVCERGITVATEGAACETCGGAFHRSCLARHALEAHATGDDAPYRKDAPGNGKEEGQ